MVLAPGESVTTIWAGLGCGVFSVSTEWAEGCGAGKGPQGQGWGSANSGRELQLGPRCPVTVLAALGVLGQ